MSFKQLVNPIVPLRVDYGQCLKQVRSAFQAPANAPTARHAADATKYRHYGRTMPNVMVPVWFDHWGTYDYMGYGKYDHVVLWVPARRMFMSSPKRGTNSVHWYGSLEAVERAIGGKYRFWSEDINGVRVVAPAPAKPAAKPATTGGFKAMAFYHRENREKRQIKKGERLYLTHSSGANRGHKQNCVGVAAKSYVLTAHVKGEGFAEGDILELKYEWFLKGITGVRHAQTSGHYTERVIADRHGLIHANPTFQRGVSKDWAVHLSVYASSYNQKTGTITVLDSDATALG